MKKNKLSFPSFDIDKQDYYGNLLLIGNGHIGYRGSFEEMDKNSKVGFNLVGKYDQKDNLWRESINLPNPLFVRVSFDDQKLSVLSSASESHQMGLILDKAIFYRHSSFPHLNIDSERFIVDGDTDELVSRYAIEVKEAGQLTIDYGLDSDIWELNGPHYQKRSFSDEGQGQVRFIGITNQKAIVLEKVSYRFSIEIGNQNFVENSNRYLSKVSIMVKPFDKIVLTIKAVVAVIEDESFIDEKDTQMNDRLKVSYKKCLYKHIMDWKHDWELAKIELKGPEDDVQKGVAYSIYHLLTLAPHKYITSIPARGLSGQTYKGAIFWDTEIFLAPFYNLLFPKVARNLLVYRLNGLNEAIKKAQKYGYDGAFYAWESQENGFEACSEYNIADAKTKKPVRTYFVDKQIHISGDVALGMFNYYEATKDASLFYLGGIKALLEIMRFYYSYARFDTQTNRYYLDDVIGPDEYHERVNNNAFTNYLVKIIGEKTRAIISSLYQDNKQMVQEALSPYQEFFYQQLPFFLEHLFLPSAQKNHLIPQFDGFFKLEDITACELVKKRTTPNEYLGGTTGLANKTRVIKQADVVTLLALFRDYFSPRIKRANYDFYLPYTEHGSSLSNSMYSLLASEVKDPIRAYDFFKRSALLDLKGDSRNYAGATYIGGLHPASAGGAVLDLIYGFAGLKFTEGQGIVFNPHLPTEIKSIRFKYYDQGILYETFITKRKWLKRRIL
ncbi:MAG TPA: glycoside hydrolase family 65 protein [Bacilli bacterium]|nr:glycoside hydrolase family 65 protein [Bacilli bacterium]